MENINVEGARIISIAAAKNEIDAIAKQIKEAAVRSETQITLYDVSDAAIMYLKENGFNITFSSNLGGSVSYYTISWNKD